MEQILATRSVSITELKRSPTAVIEQAGQEAVAVLNHNRPAAYLLSAAAYDNLLEKIEASAIREAIAASRRDPRAPISAESVFGELEACITEVATQRPGA
jgi:antitoxin StbD